MTKDVSRIPELVLLGVLFGVSLTWVFGVVVPGAQTVFSFYEALFWVAFLILLPALCGLLVWRSHPDAHLLNVLLGIGILYFSLARLTYRLLEFSELVIASLSAIIALTLLYFATKPFLEKRHASSHAHHSARQLHE